MSRKKKINVAVVGYGQWGPNFARVFGGLDGVRVAGICDADKERHALIERAWPGIPVLSDHRRLLDDHKLDAVAVATPVSTHYAIAKDALEAGKHVLVEKPISSRSSEAEELFRTAERLGKALMVGHTFLFNPAVRKVKEIIDGNGLGKIYYVHSRRTNLGPLRHDANAIWDLSPHDISIINYLLGDLPVETAAFGWNFLAHKFEDVGLISLKYPRGVPAHIHVSWLDPKKIREMTIVGSKKMLVYNDIDTHEPIRIYDKKVMKKKYDRPYGSFREFQFIVRDGSVAVPKVEQKEPLLVECSHFIDCVRGVAKPFSDGLQGRDVVRILEAIDRSIGMGGAKIKI